MSFVSFLFTTRRRLQSSSGVGRNYKQKYKDRDSECLEAVNIQASSQLRIELSIFKTVVDNPGSILYKRKVLKCEVHTHMII